MSFVRVLVAAALSGALLAAGCGGAKPTASGDANAPAPAGAALYASLDTDRDSAQWQQLNALVERVPGAKDAVDRLFADALGQSGLDWDQDVAPALGPEVVVALPGGAKEPVALTQPEDDAKLHALLARSDTKLVTREIEGWSAVAQSEAALDAYEQALAKGRLADQPAFAEATAGLPDEALARVYAEGAGLASLGSSVAGIGGSVPSAGLGTFGLALVAEQDGVRLTGNAHQQGLPGSFTPTLLDQVPAGAMLAVTFRGGTDLTAQLRDALGQGSAGNLQQLLGLSLEDLVSLLEGEGVLYVRPGLPIPELTIVLQQTNPKQADTLAALLRALAAGTKGEVTTATEDGVHVTRLALGPVTLSVGRADGRLFATTARGGIAAFESDGAKLVDEAAFQRAAKDVGYDGSTSGLLYADVDGLVPLLQGLAGLGGGSVKGVDDLAKALGALDSFMLNVTSRGDGATLQGFLAVR